MTSGRCVAKQALRRSGFTIFRPGMLPQTTPDQLTQLVSTVRLDDFCIEHGLQRIDLLKVDAERYDPQVISEAQGLFDRSSVAIVMVEVTLDNDQAGVSQFAPVFDLLIANDFLVCGLQPNGSRCSPVHDVHRWSVHPPRTGALRCVRERSAETTSTLTSGLARISLTASACRTFNSERREK